MTVRMTKQQILNVNNEQSRTIHKLMEECRHKQQIIDQMLHDKQESKPMAIEERLKAMDGRITWYVDRVNESVKRLDDNAQVEMNHSAVLYDVKHRVEALEKFKHQIDVADDIIADRMQIMEGRLAYQQTLINNLQQDNRQHIYDHQRWLEERAEDLTRIEAVCIRAEEKIDSLTPSDPLKYEKEAHAKKGDPFIAHEALDRTCMVQEIVDSQLLEHPGIIANQEALDLVAKASVALAMAYQLIGQKTL